MRRPEPAAAPGEVTPARPSRAAPVVLFLVVAGAIVAAAALAYAAGAADLRRQQEHELATIALLKVREVVRWRDERLADAATVALDLARELGQGASPAVAVARMHDDLRAHREYPALAFVDANGEVRAASGAQVEEFSDPGMRAFSRHAIQSQRPSLTRVHRHGDDAVLHLNAVVPVPPVAGRTPGAVVLRIDPYRQFFAMLREWPRPSETAETLLVGSDEGEAVIVNDLRDGTRATAVRVPMSHRGAPAARAAAGVTGVVEALDHRGRAVLAATAPVPDSPWGLVALMETREALAPLRALGLWTTAVAVALVAAVGAGAALWWRLQVDAFQRAQLAADAARRALARRLENLRKWTSDAVVVADRDSRVVDVNDRAVALFGYGRDELVGKAVRELRDPTTVGDFESRVQEQIARGGSVFETRYRRKDGSTFPAEVSVHVDEYEGRRLFQAVIRDASAREAAAEALRGSEAKFRAAFEFASLGILIVDGDGRIVETNRAMRRMLGYDDEEARGLSVRDLHDPGDETDLRILEEMKAGKRDTVELPRRYRRKDGTPFDTILRASALRDDAGAFRFGLGVVEDVSEKKRLEARLVFADRMASVGTLAAGVAHEINNPLAFILSNLDFALGELPAGLPDDLRRALQDAMDGAVRVREIVRDLRTFSRPADDQRSVLDPRRVLQSALGLAANEIRHRARLEVDPGEVPPVVASEHRLGQVLLNLLINAAQAIPEGRADENLVRVTTSTAPDGRAVIEVADSGSGIPPEVLPRIFDPFFTTKPVGVGTGLGLSICHGIVTQLGGEIAVESTLGKGTTFRIHLPPAPADARPAPPAAAAAAAAPDLRRGRILVVDDEALVSRAVARMLTPPHEVVTRASARAALELLASDRAFDVVLCDLMMPGMTGMELHATLRASDPALADRMVFLTGGAFTEAAREFLERVPNARLEKPIDRATLREAVSRLLPAPHAPSAGAAG